MKRLFFYSITCLIVLSQTARSEEQEDKKWVAQLPPVAKNSQTWINLLQLLQKKDLPFTTIAAASRMLFLFQDLKSKEAAFRAIVYAIDRGYPYPSYHYFLSADITPTEDPDFVNSYNLYKAIINEESQLSTWSQNYFSLVDPDFPKLLFYKALQAYKKKNYKESQQLLDQILKRDFKKNDLPFIKKVSRTLARIYFDQRLYSKSLDIYQHFLLRLNPVTPSDWIEAAWNLYHLKKYPEALGMLYNLESQAKEPFINLERFVIRALIYKDTCSIQNIDELIASFQKDFGKTIDAIKLGEPLNKLPILKELKLPITAAFRQNTDTLEQLRVEKENWPLFLGESRDILDFVFTAEEKSLNQKIKVTEDESLQRAASMLIMIFEQLKFLKFGVEKQKISPDSVFSDLPQKQQVFEPSQNGYVIRWPQLGDFWRDERLNFQAGITNKCMK